MTLEPLQATAQGGLGVSGGSGSPVVRAFPFAFNTPGLLTGATMYVPTIGDVLLDAWLEITTRWNAFARGDFGEFTGNGTGWITNLANLPAPRMDIADVDSSGSNAPPIDGLLTGLNQASGFAASAIEGIVPVIAEVNGAGPTLKFVPGTVGARTTPGRFTLANPVKVCVSSNGTPTGADPGATQGAAVLYLITVTPATP